ncbi:MAG: 2-hydroxyacyl-CoA dehydratase [Candidatus Nealsonbacteria bacterium]
MKKPIVTFARWGNYSIAFASLLRQLGLEVIPPEKANPSTIIEGSKLTPEMFCFPMKATVGSYLPALKKGANTVFMVQNVGGSCRQRYYGAIQRKILKEAGWEVDFIDLRTSAKDIFTKLKKISGVSSWELFKVAVFFFKKLNLIEGLERKCQYYRPREIKKGKTDKILLWSFLELENLKDQKDFNGIKREILRRFSKVKLDKSKILPRIALIGEIYTVCDPAINFETERKLGLEGIEVHRQMDLSYHLKKILFPWKDWIIQKKINPYLKSTVGGHGRDAIYEMLDYCEKGFDGVIQILPMACMPEVTVRPILEKIHKEKGIPFLSLSIDEQVAEAGINTRLEAFVDVILNYFKNKKA